MLVEQAQTILGYRFNNPSLLIEAITHASIADSRVNSNERMEFLGDSILGFVVSAHLFQRFPEQMEGDLTKLKSAVVSRRVCAQVSEELGLVSLLSLGKGMAGKHKLPRSVAAAVLESVIAAIYLDGGLESARDFILRHIDPFIDEAHRSTHQQNYKSLLQQHAQRNLPVSPMYVLLTQSGPDHHKSFEVCVELQGRRFESAWALSKKEAEQTAAFHALCGLGVLVRDPQGLWVERGGEAPPSMSEPVDASN